MRPCLFLKKLLDNSCISRSKAERWQKSAADFNRSAVDFWCGNSAETSQKLRSCTEQWQSNFRHWAWRKNPGQHRTAVITKWLRQRPTKTARNAYLVVLAEADAEDIEPLAISFELPMSAWVKGWGGRRGSRGSQQSCAYGFRENKKELPNW